MLPNIAVAILFGAIFYILARLGKYAVRKIDKHTAGDSALVRLLANAVYAAILALGLFVILSVVQLDKAVTSLLAGAGIIGLALGFAFQDTAANLLAGIILAIRKPIKIGDIIESNDHTGIVKALNLRSTIIRNFQGEAVYIPNKSVLYNPIVNFSRYPARRLDLTVGVSYGEDLSKVKKVALEAVKDIEHLDKNKKTHVWFKSFGDSSINFTLAIWMDAVKQPMFNTFRSDVIMALKTAFDQNDIMIPFPIRTLDFGIKGGEKLNEMELHMSNTNGKNNTDSVGTDTSS